MKKFSMVAMGGLLLLGLASGPTLYRKASSSSEICTVYWAGFTHGVYRNIQPDPARASAAVRKYSNGIVTEGFDYETVSSEAACDLDFKDVDGVNPEGAVLLKGERTPILISEEAWVMAHARALGR